jgi:hypothetical protein
MVSLFTVTMGVGFTVTVPVAVGLMQPAPDVYTTEYEVVAFGETVIEGVVAPVFQANVPPGTFGVAVKVAELPSQIVTLFTDTAATGLTVTVPEAWLAEHPAPET